MTRATDHPGGDLKPWASRFLDHLTTQKQASANTVKSYARDLQQFLAFLDRHDLPADAASVTPQIIQKHMVARHQDGLAPSSLQRELSAIRVFFRYLVSQKIMPQSPVLRVNLPKKARRLPEPVAVDALNALLDIPADTPLDIRDKAMWELFYSSGLRLHELVALDLEDLDIATGNVLVRHGKGNKSRLVPVGSKALDSIHTWLPHRSHLAAAGERAVFVTRRGKRISDRNVQARLRQWCLQTGAEQLIHPHQLRHSFASHMLESSGELRAIQELLGHANLTTTQIYTHLDFQHLASVYDKAHPRARKK